MTAVMSLDQIETGSFAAEEVIRRRTQEIKVISWNIARGAELQQITEFLANANADLILLQETDLNARRTGRRNVAADIASALGMNYAFGIEFEELTQGSPASPAYHGQATLSVLPLSDCRIVRFRSQSRFWHPYWWIPRLASFQRRMGGRMALLSHVAVGETTLVIYNLHLESRSDHTRRAQLAELIDDASRYDGQNPVILGGDFNFDVTESATASAIEGAHFHNAFDHQRMPTVRSRSLGRSTNIDWILIRGRVRTTAVRVHSSVCASDHYPLSVTLQLS